MIEWTVRSADQRDARNYASGLLRCSRTGGVFDQSAIYLEAMKIIQSVVNAPDE